MGRQLFVDIGNQRIKWLFLDPWSPPATSRLEWLIEQTMGSADIAGDDGKSRAFDLLFAEEPPPHKIFVSSVSDDRIATAFNLACEQHWGCSATLVKSQSKSLGLVNGYADPAQLGVDRWLAALAAFKSSIETSNGYPVIVIDAGTAITVDLVCQGRFQGGAILPGVTTLIQSLATETDKIEVDFVGLAQKGVKQNDSREIRKIEVVAKDSAAAVKAGVIASAVGGINYCVEQMSAGLNQAPEILLTGGDASLLGPLLNHQIKTMPNLVITGLALIAMDNE